MKKHINLKLWLITFGVGVILVLFSAIDVQGSSTQNYIGGVLCTAEKYVTVSAYTWGVGVNSVCISNIGTIGYTYWTWREKCGSDNITYQNVLSGYAEYNDNSVMQNSGSISYHGYCQTGQRTLWSLGNHDFKQYGYVWRPYLEEHGTK